MSLSVCTACGEFYTYRGELHCSLEDAPIQPTTDDPEDR